MSLDVARGILRYPTPLGQVAHLCLDAAPMQQFSVLHYALGPRIEVRVAVHCTVLRMALLVGLLDSPGHWSLTFGYLECRQASIDICVDGVKSFLGETVLSLFHSWLDPTVVLSELLHLVQPGLLG